MWSKSRCKNAKKKTLPVNVRLYKTSLLKLPLCFSATSWWLARVSWNPSTSSVRHKRNSSQLGNAHTAPHDTVHGRGANSSGGEEKCTQVQVAAGYWFLNAWNNHNNGNKKSHKQITAKLLLLLSPLSLPKPSPSLLPARSTIFRLIFFVSA